MNIQNSNNNFNFIIPLNEDVNLKKNFNKSKCEEIFSKSINLICEGLKRNNYKESFRFHVIDQKKHYLFVVDLSKKLGKNAYAINEMELFSFEDTQKLRAPPTQDEFFKKLKTFPSIRLEGKKAEEKVKEVVPLPDCIIPERNRSCIFWFSKEFNNGLEGKRKDDHWIDLNIINKCLNHNHTIKKLIKAINKLEPRKRVKDEVLYYKVYSSDPENYKLLLVVFKPLEVIFKPLEEHQVERHFSIITAYYVDSLSVLKDHLGLSAEQFKDFLEKRPEINKPEIKRD